MAVTQSFRLSIRSMWHSFVGVVFAVALVLLVGALAGSAQTGIYLYTGSESTITLNPGLYDITAYGAQGGGSSYGGSGGGGGYSGGGSGGDFGDGGGGGSIIDSSAIMVLSEVSGVASPNGSPNGEVIIRAVPVPEPSVFGLLAVGVITFLVRRR